MPRLTELQAAKEPTLNRMAFRYDPLSPEVDHDLSQQQQLLDVVIVRRRRGRSPGTLPDGLGDLAEHNLITFK